MSCNNRIEKKIRWQEEELLPIRTFNTHAQGVLRALPFFFYDGYFIKSRVKFVKRDGESRGECKSNLYDKKYSAAFFLPD